ncbi:MAG: DNA polymerase IV, partial [Flavobacteriia bacterium]
MATRRSIVHMDLDTFFVSCERLLDSRLNHKPILIGGTSERGVVASCSYEARRFGVHSGMSMKMAKERCPEAVCIKGNTQTYSKFSRLVTDVIKEAVPVYEKMSIDEFYIDFTGMDRFFGIWTYASELRTRIVQETGLPISFGLSENKTVSKVATGEAKPNNQLHINYGAEKDFLAPLSVQKIPMVGPKTYQTLCSLGVKKIGTLQALPLELVEQAL